jgi:hypothetical protein
MLTALIALGDVQIPLLAAMLLGGCAGKFARTMRHWSMDAGLGPTALFPLRLRRPTAMAMCATEFGLGIGLILTSGQRGQDGPAEFARIGTGLLFVVATCALIELRNIRPDVGCGCFGDFSTAPITGRVLARSALLAVAALATVRLPPLRVPPSAGSAGLLLFFFTAELAFIAVLSPEVRETLVRIGYSAPCELRVLAPEQTLAALRRSTQWRRHSSLIADQQPADVWRELCWRYYAFSSRYADRDAELVFAVYLEQRRPAVHSVLVDAVTGAVLPWPVESARPAGALLPPWLRRVPERVAERVPELAPDRASQPVGAAGLPDRSAPPGATGGMRGRAR